jgi:hypothetical protein
MTSHLATVTAASSETSGVMENCTMRGIEIMKTDTRNCTLYYVEIQTSNITDSKLYNCKVFNSTIKTSELFNTRLHESIFEKSRLSGCKITISPLALRRFPGEICLMILKLCLESKDGEIPALLVALRTDEFLYLQVIRIFYKLNDFFLNWSTISSCSKASKKAISNMSKLCIE